MPRASSRARASHCLAKLRRCAAVPAWDAPLETEALLGEAVIVYEEAGRLELGATAARRHVGYLPSAALGQRRSELITSRRSAPTAIPGRASSCRLRGDLARGPAGDRRSRAISGSTQTGRIISRVISRPRAHLPDFVEIAERFSESPYLWGGRTSEGIDCSGLVQTG